MTTLNTLFNTITTATFRTLSILLTVGMMMTSCQKDAIEDMDIQTQEQQVITTTDENQGENVAITLNNGDQSMLTEIQKGIIKGATNKNSFNTQDFDLVGTTGRNGLTGGQVLAIGSSTSGLQYILLELEVLYEVSSPVWSGNGDKIAFCITHFGTTYLATIQPDGSNLNVIAQTETGIGTVPSFENISWADNDQTIVSNLTYMAGVGTSFTTRTVVSDLGSGESTFYDFALEKLSINKEGDIAYYHKAYNNPQNAYDKTEYVVVRSNDQDKVWYEKPKDGTRIEQIVFIDSNSLYVNVTKGFNTLTMVEKSIIYRVDMQPNGEKTVKLIAQYENKANDITAVGKNTMLLEFNNSTILKYELGDSGNIISETSLGAGHDPNLRLLSSNQGR